MVQFRQRVIEASLHDDLDAEVRTGGRRLFVWLGLVLATSIVVCLIPFEQVVVVPGTIRVAGVETLIRASSAGVVKALPVREGAKVEAGQPLIEIRTPELEAALARAQGEASRAAGGRGTDQVAQEEATRRLHQQEAQLPLAEARVRRAKDRMASQQTLANGGLVPRQAVGMAEDEVDQASAERVRVIQGISSARADLADLTRKAAMSGAPEVTALRAIELQQDRMTVKAERPGRVEWIGVNPGDPVAVGQRLVRVAPDRQGLPLEVVVLLPVDRMGSLHQGLWARVAVNGYEVGDFGYGKAMLTRVGRDPLTQDQAREIDPGFAADHVVAQGSLEPREWGRLNPEPGMTVRAWVVLGRRSLISRLLAKIG